MITGELKRDLQGLAVVYNPSSEEQTSGRSDGEIVEGVMARRTIRWTVEACQYSAFGTIDCDNCLGAADARRFVRFIRQAWAEDPPLRYLDEYDRRRLGAGGQAGDGGEELTFRRLQLAGDLHDALPAVERFRRPAAVRETT